MDIQMLEPVHHHRKRASDPSPITIPTARIQDLGNGTTMYENIITSITLLVQTSPLGSILSVKTQVVLQTFYSSASSKLAVPSKVAIKYQLVSSEYVIEL